MGQSRDEGTVIALRRRAADADRVEPRGIRKPFLRVGWFLRVLRRKYVFERGFRRHGYGSGWS